MQRQNIEKLYIESSEAHKSITQSINYAAFIQNAMIKKTPSFSSYFKNSFILFKPKDIVGGDFYWYSQVDDKIIVAAADCTGHGVPGAFITVLGNNILNQIVNVSKITNPSEILLRTHQSVKGALNQDNSKNQDGMDISLCTLDLKNKKLYFAGANNPLMIIKDGVSEIIKGDRYGIGGYAEMIYKRKMKASNISEMYNTHTLGIEKNMSIYMFSDGFQDQIGGSSLKKLKSRNFYKVLEKYSTEIPKTQEKELFTYFEDWRGEYEQIDDVLVLGIKF